MNRELKSENSTGKPDEICSDNYIQGWKEKSKLQNYFNRKFFHSFYDEYWFIFSILLFAIASFFAFQLIWLDQEQAPDSVEIWAENDVSRNYLGLYPPEINLTLFKDENGGRSLTPAEFKEYVNGRYTNHIPITSFIFCSPYRENYFEVGLKTQCYFNIRINGIWGSTEFVEGNRSSKFFFDLVPKSSVFLCSGTDSNDCTNSCDSKIVNEYSYDYYKNSYIPFTNENDDFYDLRSTIIFDNPLEQGTYSLRVLIYWEGNLSEYIIYPYKIENIEKKINNTAIMYSGNTLNIRSKEDVWNISQKEKERGYQLIIALFALFGIFPAVYYLRKLWRNTE
jgi:hypothetical protein